MYLKKYPRSGVFRKLGKIPKKLKVDFRVIANSNKYLKNYVKLKRSFIIFIRF